MSVHFGFGGHLRTLGVLPLLGVLVSGCGDIPGQQRFNAVDGMVGDAREHVAQLAFGVETVQLRRADQAVNRGGTLAARIRSCEEIVLAALGNDT